MSQNLVQALELFVAALAGNVELILAKNLVTIFTIDVTHDADPFRFLLIH